VVLAELAPGPGGFTARSSDLVRLVLHVQPGSRLAGAVPSRDLGCVLALSWLS